MQPKRCVICGDAFELRGSGHGGHNRQICYSEACMLERNRRRETGKTKHGRKPHKGSSRQPWCAACGKRPHVGRVCA